MVLRQLRKQRPVTQPSPFGRVRCDRCMNRSGLTGPSGGYVCLICHHHVEPTGYERTRAEGLAKVAAARRERARARREEKRTGPAPDGAGRS
jgi:ribosomal protein S27E